MPLVPLRTKSGDQFLLQGGFDRFPNPSPELLTHVLAESQNLALGCGTFFHGVTLRPHGEDPVFSTGGYAISLFPQDSGRIQGSWVAALSGFASLFEITQTYAPFQSALAFTIPSHPEALPAASHFDTYWGRISDLPDFTQAQPMACAYPSDHQPLAGEYLIVADTSPRPLAGQANYIVTAASVGAQRRYGRQRIAASLTGRDPALLPSWP